MQVCRNSRKGILGERKRVSEESARTEALFVQSTLFVYMCMKTPSPIILSAAAAAARSLAYPISDHQSDTNLEPYIVLNNSVLRNAL